MALIAAGCLLLVTLVVALFGVDQTGPSCPVGYFSELAAPSKCLRFVNPSDAPSSIEVVPATEGNSEQARVFIFVIGGLGALIITAVGVRLIAGRQGSDAELGAG